VTFPNIELHVHLEETVRARTRIGAEFDGARTVLTSEAV